jgi:hypothetical protein
MVMKSHGRGNPQTPDILFPVSAARLWQEVTRVVERFLREGPKEEVARFRLLWKKAVKKGGLRQVKKRQMVVQGKVAEQWRVTEEWKWVATLLM